MLRKPLRALVVGDYIEDRYLVSRMDGSLEGPASVAKVIREESYPGGAGYVARLLCGFGVEVQLLCFDDGFKKSIKTRIVDDCYRSYVRFDKDPFISDYMIQHRCSLIDKLPGSYSIDFVILSDYNKGVLDQRFVDEIIFKYPYVFSDPYPNRVELCQGSFCIKVNKREAELWWGKAIRDVGDAFECAHVMADKLLSSERICSIGCGVVIITLGRLGMVSVLETLIKDDKTVRTESFVSAKDAKIVDTIGAGDVVVAAFATAYMLSKAWVISLQFASDCAQRMITKPGTIYTVEKDMLDRFLNKLDKHVGE